MTRPNPHPSLTIYKACAGSGKTYTLTKRYIELLIIRPDNFRHILAVTFTNKATDEMKMRIMRDLYALSHGHLSSQGLCRDLATSLGLSEEEVIFRAGKSLSLLLHGYSDFNVQTIDSFFQKVLRNLAYELGISSMPRIELNDIDILDQSVDIFFRSLKDTDERMSWVVEFMQQKLDDSKDWNISKDIKRFGQQLFKDKYKQEKRRLHAVISDKDCFNTYRFELTAIKEHHVQLLKGYGERFLSEMLATGLSSEDFAYKRRGVAGFFEKLILDDNYRVAEVNSYVNNCLLSAERWISKNSVIADMVMDKAISSWMTLLSEAVVALDEAKRVCLSVDYTLKNLHQLRLLECINEEMVNLTKDLNCFLLSDTHSLLHDVIFDDEEKSSDAPFIFERTGSDLQHIMIDEFQDTGVLQWKNFRLLLTECMSHSVSRNIIVGDVKQSIYRWRAGDWKLLQHLKTGIGKMEKSISEIYLTRNWRSRKNIILFNNAFFLLARELEQMFQNEKLNWKENDEVISAYADVEQQMSPLSEDGGYVCIRLFENVNHEKEERKAEEKESTDDYELETLKKLTCDIRTLTSRGVDPSDIAILCRRNKELSIVAAHLSKYIPETPLSVRNAFRLDNSSAVCCIVEAMRLLVEPENKISLAFITTIYQQHVLKRSWHESILSDIIAKFQPTEKEGEDERGEKREEIENGTEKWHNLLPEEYVNSVSRLHGMPVYDLAEHLYNIFGLHVIENEASYVSAFFDHLQRIMNNAPIDIISFLYVWDSNLYKKNITTTLHNGIQLLTVHTSKGLEFPYVFMPFTDWNDLGKDNDIGWFHPVVSPFDALPVVPVNIVKNLSSTIYSNEYKEEMMQRAIDRFNLLYVGFTRAQKGLFVMGRIGGQNLRSELIQKVLDIMMRYKNGDKEVLNIFINDVTNVLNVLPSLISKTDDCVSTSFRSYEFGNFDIGEEEQDSSKSLREKERDVEYNPFDAVYEDSTVSFTPQKPCASFIQSNESARFVNNDPEVLKREQFIDRGRVLHFIFSRINTYDDIDNILYKLRDEGLLSNGSLSFEETRRMIHSVIGTDPVKSWFSSGNIVINERSIAYRASSDGVIRHVRPDRIVVNEKETIVIDFKFGKEKDEYHDQVSTYMSFLEQMGYKNVKGYLWYVYQNHVVEIIKYLEQ